MKKTLSIVLCVLLVLLAVACSPESSTHVHEWEKTSESTATCEKDGSETWTCKICKESEVRPVEATGHTHAANVKGSSDFDGGKEVTCSENGYYAFRCTSCGKTFYEVVTPEQAKASKLYTVSHVYLEDGDYVAYDKKKAGYEDHIQYLDGDIKAETMLTAKSKVARCESCGETMPKFNVVVGTESNPTYALMNGMWVYKGLSDGVAKVVYYVDIAQSKDANGTVSTTSHVVGSNFGENGWTTDDAAAVVEFDSSVGDSGTRALKVTIDSSCSYWIQETSDGYTLKYDDKSTSGTYDGTNNNTVDILYSEAKNCLKDSNGNIIGSIEFIPDHNHKYSGNTNENLYNATDDNKKTNIHFDSYFKVMSFMGNNYCNGTEHYVSCEKCGLSYYKVKCAVASEGKTLATSACVGCGYTSESGKYVSLNIKKSNDPNLKTSSDAAESGSGNAIKAATKAGGASGNESIKSLTALSTAKTDLENAKTALEKIEKKESDAYKAVTWLLTSAKDDNDEAVKAEPWKVSVIDALTKLGTGDTSDADTALDGAVKNLLGETKTSTVGLGGYTATSAIKSVAYALDLAATEITGWMNSESADVEGTAGMRVKKNSIIKLSNAKYENFFGKTYSFASNTGWDLGDGKSAILTDSGIQFVGNSELTFFEKN